MPTSFQNSIMMAACQLSHAKIAHARHRRLIRKLALDGLNTDRAVVLAQGSLRQIEQNALWLERLRVLVCNS